MIGIIQYNASSHLQNYEETEGTKVKYFAKIHIMN
jgi:hypothetical protein